MTQTTHYQLNQWDAADQVRRTDFNADNAKLDAALGALQALADAKGNCRAKFGFYTGDGNEKRVMSIETDFPPKALLVFGYRTTAFITRGAERQYITYQDYGYQIIPAWTDTGVSWTGTGLSKVGAHILNDSNTVYCYAVFG